MAYENVGGMPSFIPYPQSSGSGDFLGGGGIGSLLIGALLFGGGLGGLGGNRNMMGNGMGMGGGYVPGVVEGAQSGALAGLTQQVTSLASQVSANGITDQITNGFAGIDAGITSVNQNISGTSRDLLNSISNLATSQASGNFTTLSSINGLGRDIIASQNQAALQSLNSFNQLQSSMYQGFNANTLGMSNGFNSVATGLSNLSREMAECCCGIKNEIHADGEATRTLINNINVQSLQGQLADAKSALNNANQTNYLQSALNQQSSVIISHLAPRPIPVVA